MKVLLVDAGNSRIKWGVLNRGRIGKIYSASWHARNLSRTVRRILRANSHADIIAVCQVAGSEFVQVFRATARAICVADPVFVRTVREASGVTNGYRNAGRLGVDRWMALLGAHQKFPGRALCLFGVGTAMTIDLIDRHGRHRGGAILPGPQLMIESLLQRTALIRRRARHGHGTRRSQIFAVDTRAAVEAGSANACAAVAVRAVEEARRLTGRELVVLWTGGQAREIRKLAGIGGRLVNDLVIRGLAVSVQSSQL